MESPANPSAHHDTIGVPEPDEPYETSSPTAPTMHAARFAP